MPSRSKFGSLNGSFQELFFSINFKLSDISFCAQLQHDSGWAVLSSSYRNDSDIDYCHLLPIFGQQMFELANIYVGLNAAR